MSLVLSLKNPNLEVCVDSGVGIACMHACLHACMYACIHICVYVFGKIVGGIIFINSHMTYRYHLEVCDIQYLH